MFISFKQSLFDFYEANYKIICNIYVFFFLMRQYSSEENYVLHINNSIKS